MQFSEELQYSSKFEKWKYVIVQVFLKPNAMTVIGKREKLFLRMRGYWGVSETIKDDAFLEVLSTIDTAKELKEAVIEEVSEAVKKF